MNEFNPINLDEIFSTMVTKPEHAKLSEVERVDKLPIEVREAVKKGYNATSLNERLLAVVLNACITQDKLTFLFSRNILMELLEKDRSVKRKTLNGSEYQDFVNTAKANGHLTLIKEGKGIKSASVFELTVDSICQFVRVRKSNEYFDLQKKRVLEIHKSSDETSNKTSTADFHCKLPVINELMNNEVLKNVVVLDDSTATPSLLESSDSDGKNSINKPKHGNPDDLPTPSCAAPLPSAININPDDLRLVEQALNPESEFVQNCRAALMKYGSLSEGRRKALSRTQLPSHTPQSENSTVSRITLTDSICIDILRSNNSPEQKVYSLSAYLMPADVKQKVLQENLLMEIVVKNPDEVLFIAESFGLKLTTEQHSKLAARRERLQNKKDVSEFISSNPSVSELLAFGAKDVGSNMFIVKGVRVRNYGDKFEII